MAREKGRNKRILPSMGQQTFESNLGLLNFMTFSFNHQDNSQREKGRSERLLTMGDQIQSTTQDRAHGIRLNLVLLNFTTSGLYHQANSQRGRNDVDILTFMENQKHRNRDTDEHDDFDILIQYL